VKKQPEGAKAREWRRKRTMKSVLQSQEARVELAIPSAPKAEFAVVLLAIKPSKRF
jgi:hypothetical protein